MCWWWTGHSRHCGTAELITMILLGNMHNFYGLLADVVMVIHLLFIIYVIAGALLVLWKRWTIVLHIPAAVWGILIGFAGWICPLTPLENHFRRLARQDGFSGGFIEHYLVPIIYPAGLTPQWQWILGGLALTVNVVLYLFVYRKKFRNR